PKTFLRCRRKVLIDALAKSATRSVEDVNSTTACHWEHRRRHGLYVAGTNFDFDRPRRSGPTHCDGSSDHTGTTQTRAQPPTIGWREESPLRVAETKTFSCKTSC